MIDKLTEKQKKFCEEYVVDFNGTQAAIRAGYSEKTSNVTSSENLAKPNIQSYIQKLIKDREKRTEINADMVVKELAKIAFFDIRKIFHQDGRLVNPCDLDDDTACVISGIKVRDVKSGENIERPLSIPSGPPWNSRKSAAAGLPPSRNAYSRPRSPPGPFRRGPEYRQLPSPRIPPDIRAKVPYTAHKGLYPAVSRAASPHRRTPF